MSSLLKVNGEMYLHRITGKCLEWDRNTDSDLCVLPESLQSIHLQCLVLLTNESKHGHRSTF